MTLASNSPRSASRRAVALLLIAEFLLTLAFQLPGVMDFQKFAFYDEGAWLRLIGLWVGGRTPTVDLGYSYGMLPLILSRAWFAAFGLTPWAFLGFLTTCNVLAAWGVAEILHASGASWRRVGAACVLLPLAIMPNNYSLMHPLEAMLILWALAQQARGRYGAALVLAVLAVFTKPSMAYVLGLLLLILGTWRLAESWGIPGTPRSSPRHKRRLWGLLLPPTAAALAMTVFSILCVGFRPTVANLLPLTGGRSYQDMDFGIFHAGRAFWLFSGDSGWTTLKHYLFTPALFWILASLLVWALGLRAGYRLWRARGVGTAVPRATDPLVLTLALLHAAFVFFFYAWAGSWTYYSYLPVLALLVGPRGRRQTIMLRVLLVVAAAGLSERFADAYFRWYDLHRSADSGGLFVYADVLHEAQAVRQVAQEHHALFLVNGALPLIWPEAETPAVWFLSPGIPTQAEIRQVQEQLDHAGAVVLYKDYDQKQEAWYWPEFATQRKAFELRTWRIFIWTFKEEPLFESTHFLVLRRHEL